MFRTGGDSPDSTILLPHTHPQGWFSGKRDPSVRNGCQIPIEHSCELVFLFRWRDLLLGLSLKGNQGSTTRFGARLRILRHADASLTSNCHQAVPGGAEVRMEPEHVLLSYISCHFSHWFVEAGRWRGYSWFPCSFPYSTQLVLPTSH